MTIPSSPGSSSHVQLPAVSSTTSGYTASVQASASSSSNWHSVRPWTPRTLTLQILQVTSLSIAFMLSSTPSSTLASTLTPSATNLSLLAGGTGHSSASAKSSKHGARGRRRKKGSSKVASTTGTSSGSLDHKGDKHHFGLDLGHGNDDFSEDDEAYYEGDSISGTTTLVPSGGASDEFYVNSGNDGSGASFATLLSKGVVVSVNGQAWREVVAHVLGEWEDEAVVIVYGLSPGREYTIELGLVGEEAHPITAAASTRSVEPLTTNPSSTLNTSLSANHLSGTSTPPRSRANSLRSRSRANSASSPLSGTPIGIPDSIVISEQPSPSDPPGSEEPASTPAPPSRPSSPPQLSVESHISTLRIALSLSQAENSSLLNLLKTTRKNTQKTDSALRTEITTLQRALEKTSSTDSRARQKVLALQETVKRTHAGAIESEKEAESVDEGLDALKAQEETVKKEWESVDQWVKGVEEDESAKVEENKRMLEKWDAEIVSLAGKVEKIEIKRDRAEHDVRVLEARLMELEKEKEDIASGTHPIFQQRQEALHQQHHHQQQNHGRSRFDNHGNHGHHFSVTARTQSPSRFGRGGHHPVNTHRNHFPHHSHHINNHHQQQRPFQVIRPAPGSASSAFSTSPSLAASIPVTAAGGLRPSGFPTPRAVSAGNAPSPQSAPVTQSTFSPFDSPANNNASTNSAPGSAGGGRRPNPTASPFSPSFASSNPTSAMNSGGHSPHLNASTSSSSSIQGSSAQQPAFPPLPTSAGSSPAYSRPSPVGGIGSSGTGTTISLANVVKGPSPPPSISSARANSHFANAVGGSLAAGIPLPLSPTEENSTAARQSMGVIGSP